MSEKVISNGNAAIDMVGLKKRGASIFSIDGRCSLIVRERVVGGGGDVVVGRRWRSEEVGICSDEDQ